MAENEFLNGLRVDQFIKSNNDQIKESISDFGQTLDTNVKTILKNQTTQITSLASIDKSTKSMNTTMSKLLDNQKKLIDVLKDRREEKGLTQANMKSMLKSVTTKKEERRDSYKRVSYDEENNDLLASMTKSLGILTKPVKDKGGGFWKSILLGGAGLLAGGGLIGYILTGKKEGLQGMVKGLVKGFDTAFGITKAIPKFFDSMGTVFKTIGSFKKIAARVGIGKGLKLFGGRALGKGLAKGAGKTALKNIPGIGSVLNLIFSVQKFKKGDVVGGLLELGSFAADFIPVAGPFIGLALDLYSLKRDLTISEGDLQTQKEIFTNPAGAIRTLMQGRRDQRDYEQSQAADPSFNRGISRLRSLNMDQRRGFSEWQQQTHGRVLNVSNIEDKLAYEQMVEDYRQHLGVGGGGFQFSDSHIAQENGNELQAGRDDNWTQLVNRFKYQMSRIGNFRNRKHVKLNPNEQPSLIGLNPTMKARFYRMAREFHDRTGGYFMVNSAKRSGGGDSVHNFGYAIDANAMGADGRRFGDGYIPEDLLVKHGFHRPLLHYKSVYGGPVDEPWHIEPYPGAELYGGDRNTLAEGQPYRKGVLLAGGNGYTASPTPEIGGGGFDRTDFNLPQGQLARRRESNSPTTVMLSQTDIMKLAEEFGKQIKKNTKESVSYDIHSNPSNPRTNL